MKPKTQDLKDKLIPLLIAHCEMVNNDSETLQREIKDRYETLLSEFLQEFSE